MDRLSDARIVVELADGTTHEASFTPSREHALGPVLVDLVETTDGWSWSVANRGDAGVGVRSVGVRWDAGSVGDRPRMFRNGYQSWSRTSVAVLGEDVDPSTVEGAPALVRGMHHADARVAPPGSLRSEMVTVFDRGAGDDQLLIIGFLGGSSHDGTIWASPTDRRRATLMATACLGGAVLAPGERRSLHQVMIAGGPRDGASEMLERWARRVGEIGAARADAPYQVGWCSWYHYFHDISEASLRHNLARAGDWPFEVFQLDDGYQSDIGDWLTTNDRFGSSIDTIAADIRDAGVTPGIWLAPFLVGPESEVARSHPHWLARHASGRPLVGMVNPGWGGPVLTLDTTNPEVLDHIERTAAALVDAGFPYLKLDFTYAPSLDGSFADASRTPAERVRAGMEAVRRGAGDDTFLLGCGLPLGAAVGVVDGMRIGADVAPWWDVQPDRWNPPGYAEVEPATRNAWINTLTRSFMHRHLWLNDPDCLMLRTTETSLAPEAARAWALAVGVSGGMAIVSDDLAVLGPDARALLGEVIALGRASDALAAAGSPSRCLDLMGTDQPGVLRAGDVVLAGSADGTGATIERSG
jgi:alpha-galactosidase